MDQGLMNIGPLLIARGTSPRAGRCGGYTALLDRMPTLNDRFWRPGGDPDLRPERGWNADAGLAWAPARYRIEGPFFASATRDQIVWRPTEEPPDGPDDRVVLAR